MKGKTEEDSELLTKTRKTLGILIPKYIKAQLTTLTVINRNLQSNAADAAEVNRYEYPFVLVYLYVIILIGSIFFVSYDVFQRCDLISRKKRNFTW